MTPRPHKRVNQDRWLVSYADFITLLFGFFVLLYAFAKADQKKQMQVTESIDAAFQSLGIFPDASRKSAKDAGGGTEQAIAPINIAMGEDVLAPAKVKDDLNQIRRDLQQMLSNQVAQHTVSIQIGRDGLVISLREAGFFSSGSATPQPETLPTLRQIATSLGRTPSRFAHRGPHRQYSHPHCRIRLELGTLIGPRHPHCTDLHRIARHAGRSRLGGRLCRVPSRSQQRDRRWPSTKPPAWILSFYRAARSTSRCLNQFTPPAHGARSLTSRRELRRHSESFPGPAASSACLHWNLKVTEQCRLQAMQFSQACDAFGIPALRLQIQQGCRQAVDLLMYRVDCLKVWQAAAPGTVLDLQPSTESACATINSRCGVTFAFQESIDG